MYHSRAAALLTGDYVDRTIEATHATVVPAATGITIAWTYTVGTNIIARLEHSQQLIQTTTAVGLIRGRITVDRSGVQIPVSDFFSDVAGAGIKPFGIVLFAHEIILLAGDIVRADYNNAEAALAKTVQQSALIREINL